MTTACQRSDLVTSMHQHQLSPHQDAFNITSWHTAVWGHLYALFFRKELQLRVDSEGKCKSKSHVVRACLAVGDM